MVTSLCQVYRIIRKRYADATRCESEWKNKLKLNHNDLFYQGKVSEAESVRKELDEIIDALGRTVVMGSRCTGCRYANVSCYSLNDPIINNKDGDNK